ncbi:MAG: phosphoribosylanthranilate isomerase [Tenacibaculum sp.]
MKYANNIKQLAALQPDYLGFIFYQKSKRNFKGLIPEISKKINKTGVFVNKDIETVVLLVQEHSLEAVQLHGSETPQYIKELKKQLHKTQIIKAFSVNDNFNFNQLKPYEKLVNYFLFDAKGEKPGGNGVVFNWKLLESYNLKKPYFLSGGIGLESVSALKEFLKTSCAKHCVAIDVNSKFESKPGNKQINKLKEFKNSVFSNQ